MVSNKTALVSGITGIKRGSWNKGKKRTVEQRKRMSLIFSGMNNPFFGKKHSEKTKQLISSKNKGKLCGINHPNWKGGIRKRPDGYLRYGDDRYVHRIQVERFLGRKLRHSEFIHHIDGNPENNNIDNLKIMTNSEHRKLHCKTQEGWHK